MRSLITCDVTYVYFIELKAQENSDVLSYWLSNSSTLLLLLQRTLKATGTASLTPLRRRMSTSLFGRVSQVRQKLSLYLSVFLISKVFLVCLALNKFVTIIVFNLIPNF